MFAQETLKFCYGIFFPLLHVDHQTDHYHVINTTY